MTTEQVKNLFDVYNEDYHKFSEYWIDQNKIDPEKYPIVMNTDDLVNAFLKWKKDFC